jgi:glycerophosphoryl diester phosphodiesterase
LQIIGHRGSMATHPENTIAGFRHAMACGADGMELDVFPTIEDTLLVSHDPVIGPQLPTLDEVLSLVAPENFWFDIEAKSAPGMTPAARWYAQLLRAAIRRSSAVHRILVRSFDCDILRAFHEVEPEIPLAVLIEYASDEWVAIARTAGASIISPHYSTVTEGRVEIAHDAGIRVSTWTVNEPADWVRLAAMGVDTIITDDPAAMVLWRRAAEAHPAQ